MRKEESVNIQTLDLLNVLALSFTANTGSSHQNKRHFNPPTSRHCFVYTQNI